MKGRVLIVAGSDSGGGAGIQADIKAVTCLGAFAMTAVTALTAQNTQGVANVLPVPPRFIREQIDVVVSDLGVDSVKTGMLHDVPVIEAVAEEIAALEPPVPVVVDPVMVAKGGHRLLEENAVSALMRLMIPRATVITPNVPEAEVLAGSAILSL
ncbi:MAG: hydroxymethylpyrimidine/phosphomethylpyrimidine kinase, partial [Elioraea sp.]|nr:hydroxymethylpyrimidine/phosphomethylpyrimidine kinase [Elioraea sp.]